MDAANTLVLVTAFLLTGLFVYNNFINPIDLKKAKVNEKVIKLPKNTVKRKSKTPLKSSLEPSPEYSFISQTNQFLSNCEKYISSKRHKPYIITSNTSIKTFAKSFKNTNDIRVDFIKNHVYCFEPKAGTTNWSRMSTAISKNITFDELIRKYPHNFVYDYLPSSQQIYRHIGAKYCQN